MVEQTERQLPLRRAETAALVTLVVHAAAGALALALGRLSGSFAAEVEAWHLLVGVLVWLGVFTHQRLRRAAAEEALAAASLAQGRPDEARPSLFEAEGADLLTARNRLAQFEKYFLPAFSLVVILVLGAVSYGALRHLAAAEGAAAPTEPLRNFWAFAGIAFITFLLARYAAGLATQVPWRPLRAGANFTMSSALGSFLVAVAFVFCFFELPVVERGVAWAIPIALAALALEVLILLVMGFYRPREAREDVRPAHDSRLLGMLTTSRGIFRTTAETLDYQFGFKVSETWFYRFMERAIGPLILFQALTLELLTCFVIVDTGEQAIVERFGVPRAHRVALGPGLHVKWPWPIEIAYRYPTARVETLTIGEQLQEDVPGFEWTKTHAKQPFNLLVATHPETAPKGGPTSPALEAPPGPAEPRVRGARPVPAVNLITGTVYVFYYVEDYYDFLYNHDQPKRTLEALCYRELAAYSAGADFLDFLGYKRGEAVRHLKAAIQAAAAERKLGVKIVDVALQGLHPPIEVAGAFEEVVGALEEREAKIWNARGHASSVVPRAARDAARLLADARIYAADRQYVAPAAEKEFLMQLEASQVAPSVFRHRKLLSALEATLVEARKIVKPAWVSVKEVINLNLEEKTVPGAGMSLDVGATEGARP